MRNPTNNVMMQFTGGDIPLAWLVPYGHDHNPVTHSCALCGGAFNSLWIFTLKVGLCDECFDFVITSKNPKSLTDSVKPTFYFDKNGDILSGMKRAA